MSKYDFELDIYGKNSLSIIIEMLTRKSAKVLEVGPAHGRLTKYLKEEKKYEVDIIEVDEKSGQEASKFARKALLGEEAGNIEGLKWDKILSEERYDYIIFADVLEHLYNPELVLKRAKKLLQDDGEIIISVPNVAHNSVIIDLINDKFTYTEVGLLDNTHIRFFTYYSLKDMIARCELVPVIEEATYAQVDGVFPGIKYENIQDAYVQDVLRNRSKGNVYQFVFKLQQKEFYQVENPLTFINIDGRLSDEAVFYLKSADKEYDENKTVRKKIHGTKHRIRIDFPQYDNVCAVRFDPFNSPCLVHVTGIWVYDVNQNKIERDIRKSFSNANKTGDGFYLFRTNDPQIEICFAKDDIVGLEVEYQIYKLYNEGFLNCFFDLLEQKVIEREKKDMVLEERQKLQKECESLLIEKKQFEQETEVLKQDQKRLKTNEQNMLQERINAKKQNEELILKNEELILKNEELILKNKELVQTMEKIYASRSWKLMSTIRKVLGR